MKTYISDIIPKIQKFSRKLDELTLLTNQHWVVVDEIENSKNVYIFRQNNELLISQNGKVEKAKWEYLGHNTLLIDRKNESFLFKHGFFDENILALKTDGKNEYAFLVNETKFETELNSIKDVAEFLNKKYINPQSREKQILSRLGIEDNNQNKIIYTAPNHKLVAQTVIYSMVNGEINKYWIEFDDDIEAVIYVVQDNKYAYFKERPKGHWFNVKYLYKDMESCINAIHYFKKNKKELTTGLIDKYEN